MPIFQKSPRPDPLFCAIDVFEFPAQAIAAYEPSLRGRPFVVTCQDPQNHKSAVWACSGEAVSLGVRRGMPIAPATKRFPQLATAARNKELESAVIQELKRVFDHYSPQFYISDFGASLIDLTGTPSSRTMAHREIAAKLREDIRKAVALDALAIGLGRSAVVARLLAKKARPSGICVCESGDETALLAAMESKLLPGLSDSARERLAAYGLLRIGQVKSLGKEALMRRFGTEGEKLYALSQGLYLETRAAASAPIVAETTLDRDINDMKKLCDRVRLITDKLCFLLKSSNRFIDRVTLLLTYCDGKTVQRTIALLRFTNDYSEIASRACDAFIALYERRVAVKSLKLMTTRMHVDPGQTELFETEQDRKQRNLGAQLTRVREKLSFESVRSAAQVESTRPSLSRSFK
jgi:DNA polymerase IV